MSDHTPVNVSVSANEGGVDRKVFAAGLWMTDDVGGGFPTLRQYESPSEIQADTDVNVATRDLLVDYAFAQRNRGGLSKIAVGKINYAGTISDEVAGLVAAESSTGIQWYGAAASSVVQADIEDLAAALEAYEKLGVWLTGDAAVLAGTGGNVAEVLATAAYGRSALLYHADTSERAALAWMCKKLGKDPDTGKTSWRHCELTGIASDSDTVDGTEKTTAQSDNANLYLNFQGDPATGDGVLADGNPIDTRITRDWIAARLRERVALRLKTASDLNQDIPYDQDGIDAFYGDFATLLALGESLRHFQIGASSVTKPLIQNIDAATRASRLLTLEGSAVFAGSIEEIAINLAVQF